MAWDKDFDETKLREMIERRVRIEKIAIKDVKMRTLLRKMQPETKWCNMYTISLMERFVQASIHWW
jgi:hypothetical protein